MFTARMKLPVWVCTGLFVRKMANGELTSRYNRIPRTVVGEKDCEMEPDRPAAGQLHCVAVCCWCSCELLRGKWPVAGEMRGRFCLGLIRVN